MSTALTAMRNWHRPLMFMVVTMTFLTIVASVGLVVDDRELLGESIWVKPWKFSIAFVLYGATLAWLIPQLRKLKRTAWLTGTLLALTGVVDVGFIFAQAARGTFSHFNSNTDTFNQVGQQIFQYGVIGLLGASLVIAVILLFQRIDDAALTLALRVGLVLAVSGMVAAFFIVGVGSSEDGPREVSDAYGNAVRMSGQHGVGVPDGDGMPLTNWSADGGDLRVPHFIGMHAIQLLLVSVMVLGFAAQRVEWLRQARVRTRLVAVVSLLCTGVFAITTWQALRGQSLIQPDGDTWLALAALMAVVVVATVAVVASARRNVPAADSIDPFASATEGRDGRHEAREDHPAV